MKKKIRKQRALAVQRYLAGESPQSICASLGKTKPWLYKWVSRQTPDDPAWFEDQSRRPLSSPYRTPAEIGKIVEMVRLNLYNKGLFCGNQAIQWEMSDMEVQPIPFLSTIGRILRRRELTHRRTGRYTPKGKKYPELPALSPNQTHQVDMVGPCYLTGPIRFYSLHAIDIAINRCGIAPMPSRAAQSVLDAVYAVWLRLGIPENLQVDNEMAFFGSPAHPRGMGPLIRLCLRYGVHIWFIPPAEPWWNGVVEQFNDHSQQKFLAKVPMASMAQLGQESLAFEHRHNSTYRYSKIQGKTPHGLGQHGEDLELPEHGRRPTTSLEEAGGWVLFPRAIHSTRLPGEPLRRTVPGSPGNPIRIRGGDGRCQRANVKALPGYNPGRRV